VWPGGFARVGALIAFEGEQSRGHGIDARFATAPRNRVFPYEPATPLTAIAAPSWARVEMPSLR
jgi:hypothetical protein